MKAIFDSIVEVIIPHITAALWDVVNHLLVMFKREKVIYE